ncbi:MAG: helix-turn-helix domain-containing protein [Longimicrobiales bacterium]
MVKAAPAIAATSTLAMVRTAGARGIETADLLEEAGLTHEFLEDPDAPVYVDYVFAALVSRIRMRIKPDLHVLRVELRQPEPPSTSPYVELFRATVRFGAPLDRLCFSELEWNAPTVSADTALARLLEEHARIQAQRMPQAAPSFRIEVQKAIANVLPEGGSAEDVARALHCSVRTLQRKLVATGTTFREVYETVRGQLAQEYLTDRKVSIAEVAFLLGFSDQSSFNRAFGRWTGESPGRWRRQRARVDDISRRALS